jgi:hypothetical protein
MKKTKIIKLPKANPEIKKMSLIGYTKEGWHDSFYCWDLKAFPNLRGDIMTPTIFQNKTKFKKYFKELTRDKVEPQKIKITIESIG